MTRFSSSLTSSSCPNLRDLFFIKVLNTPAPSYIFYKIIYLEYFLPDNPIEY